MKINLTIIETRREKKKNVNKKLGKLPTHQLIKQIKFDELLWDFDAVILYPSAMWDENCIYPRIEIGYAFTRGMKKELMKKFNTLNFTQGSAFLKKNSSTPRDLVVQHLLVTDKKKEIEINRTRNGYNLDYLTSVDLCEIVKNGGKVIEIYEGVIYREIFKVCPFRRIIDKLFALRQKNKDVRNEVMQLIVKLIMCSLYGE